MAEKGGRGDSSTRRSSFRKTVTEAVLPAEYLENLEQKRKQLDESIHKYIAAKEREYKQYEKDLRQQYKVAHNEGTNGAPKARAASDATPDPSESSIPADQQQQQQSTAVDALLSTGLKRSRDGQAMGLTDQAGTTTTTTSTTTTQSTSRPALSRLTDQKASLARDKEFVGVFTPSFLPALNNQRSKETEQSSPAQPHEDEQVVTDGVPAPNHEPGAQAKPKRPGHLQLVQRTSSSGSSADGKLTSALKHSTPYEKPKRKRVSLAVGDEIVAPSDNVPVAMSHNSTPSHSRVRSPAPERELSRSMQAAVLDSQTSISPERPIKSASLPTENQLRENSRGHMLQIPPRTPEVELKMSPSSPTRTNNKPSKIDPDGDLFDLEDEESFDGEGVDSRETLEVENEIVGRVNSNDIARPPPPKIQDGRYDENGGLIPESDVEEEDEEGDENDEDEQEHDDPSQIVPSSSAVASQQPTRPGFRRPSVSTDPVYVGRDYAKAELAASADVYSSSFGPKGTRASFQAASLGGSYMAQNAEHLTKARLAQDQTSVRS